MRDIRSTYLKDRLGIFWVHVPIMKPEAKIGGFVKSVTVLNPKR